MNRGFLIGIILLAAAFESDCVTRVVQASDRTRCISVLFVGDSFTYTNNLPAIVSDIARTKTRCMPTAMVASGGESLRDHWVSRDFLKALKSRQWAYVVFQDQSTFGDAYIVNGQYRVPSATGFFAYGDNLAEEARRHGAVPVFFLPWVPRGTPERDAQYVRWAYARVSSKNKAVLVPVFDAWKTAERDLPDLNLYNPDGLHATAAGSYLAAALFVAKLDRTSPVGAGTVVQGAAVDFQSGVIEPKTRVLLVDLSPSVGNRLQKIAATVAASAIQQPAKPPPIQQPAMPTGKPIASDLLEGRWLGRSSMYPYPSTITLDICTQPALHIGTSVDFGGKPQTIRFSDLRPMLTRTSLVFIDRHGPNKGVVRYTATLDDRQLSGIGEILTPNPSIYAIGSWSARKVASISCAAR